MIIRSGPLDWLESANDGLQRFVGSIFIQDVPASCFVIFDDFPVTPVLDAFNRENKFCSLYILRR